MTKKLNSSDLALVEQIIHVVIAVAGNAITEKEPSKDKELEAYAEAHKYANSGRLIIYFAAEIEKRVTQS